MLVGLELCGYIVFIVNTLHFQYVDYIIASKVTLSSLLCFNRLPFFVIIYREFTICPESKNFITLLHVEFSLVSH